MLGLFGTLNMGTQSLQTAQRGVEVAGNNLANVNNAAYARQRLVIQSADALPTSVGFQGTGVEAVRIEQIRNALLDSQLTREASVRGYLEATQSALDYGQSVLGQSIDRKASGAEGTAAAGSTANHSLADNFADLFASFQSLTATPTSLTERQAVLQTAQTLATQFNMVDSRFGDLHENLNASVSFDVEKANGLLDEIANLNAQIFATEGNAGAVSGELRDLRQEKLETLAKLVSVQATTQDNGTVDIAIGGVLVVDGVTRGEALQAYDNGSGSMLVRTATTQTPLTLTGGTIQGTIEARDQTLAGLRRDINTLASTLITQTNAIFSTGYSLTGSTGAAMFEGTNASTIKVNQNLMNNPALFQASDTAGAAGNNGIALKLAQLGNQALTALNNQTFSQSFAHTVSSFGQALSTANTNLSDQTVVERMLLRQRESYSGVSLDEEMTSLIQFQKAFEASARIVNIVDEMLSTLINM